MIQQSDIAGRLRLFRYGLIVIVIITFLVSLLAPYVITAPYAAAFDQVADNVPQISITTFLGSALITSAIVGVIMVVVYFVYRMYLMRGAKS